MTIMVILSGKLIGRGHRDTERLPNKLELKVGAWVILRRNMHTEGGWTNSTLAVVTSMHPNFVVIAKLANPSHKYPVPGFCQRTEIQGAVHHVQGCTVQNAIVCLGSTFFVSGQVCCPEWSKKPR